MRKFSIILATASALTLSGCAGGVGLTMLGVGAGTAAGTGVNHTLNGIAYKTFPEPAEDVRKASVRALGQLAMNIDKQADTPEGKEIYAKANKRSVEIRIEELTPKTSQMRVTVIEDNGFLRDSATATEVIIQTAQSLDQIAEERRVSQSAEAKPAAKK